MMSSKLRRVATGILYLLPVIFFAVCYFLITTTEEDIIQGAGTTPDVWNDLVAAFRNNARLSDMYAWAVINFFDYQYSFGVDTIFRLLDVAAAVGVVLLIASVILGHRPRWNLKDVMVYLGSFLLIVLTPYGYTFYRGFSMAHNYLIIALAMLGFGLPFVRKLSGTKIPRLYRKWWVAVPMGLVFGLSANFPPLAFLATYVLVKAWQWWKVRKQEGAWRKILPEAWEWMMIGGMLASLAIGYILGPGVSGYASDPMYATTYDYVTLSSVFQDFGGATVRIFRHMAMNFGRTLAPVVAVLAGGWILAWMRARLSKKNLRFLPEDTGTRRILASLLIFSGFVVLAGSQIIMPIRLCMPAYLALIIVVVILVRGWWGDLGERWRLAGCGMMTGLALVAIVLRAGFAWSYHEQVRGVFDTIEHAEGDTVLVDFDSVQQRPKMPLGMFQQEETFVRRQETTYEIYGKKIVYD